MSIPYLSLAEKFESASIGVQLGADDVVGIGGGVENTAILANFLPKRLGQAIGSHTRPFLFELSAQLIVRLLLLRQQARRLKLIN